MIMIFITKLLGQIISSLRNNVQMYCSEFVKSRNDEILQVAKVRVQYISKCDSW